MPTPKKYNSVTERVRAFRQRQREKKFNNIEQGTASNILDIKEGNLSDIIRQNRASGKAVIGKIADPYNPSIKLIPNPVHAQTKVFIPRRTNILEKDNPVGWRIKKVQCLDRSPENCGRCKIHNQCRERYDAVN